MHKTWGNNITLHWIDPFNLLLPGQVSFPPFFLQKKKHRGQNARYYAKRSQKTNHIEREIILTHSSITSPSPPTIRGPVSSGGFLRVSSAASASANCRLSFSIAFTKGKMKLFKHYKKAWQIKDISVLLTGVERSGSRKTTRKICSTATWSLCSSNCVEVSYNNTFSLASKHHGGLNFVIKK